MATITVSLPDDLLAVLDAEAKRRRTSRGAILESAVRRELGLPRRESASLLSELDRISQAWDGPVDSGALVRAERLRDG